MNKKQEIIDYLKTNITPDSWSEIEPTEKNWSIADLFLRQYLNNMCDGFGMKNVCEVYDYLCEIKSDLIKFNLISKEGWNNSGYPIWDNFEIHETYPENREFRGKAAAVQQLQQQLLAKYALSKTKKLKR